MLYAPGDSRRDRAYSVFYVGTNLGAFLAPLVAGTLGEEVGWRYGFGAAGVGMIVALAIYLWGWKHLARRRPAPKTDKHGTSAAQRARNGNRSGALILLVIPLTLWWACYEQQGNIIALFADGQYRPRLIPGLIDWQIPVTWFQSFNPFMIFAFTPFLIALWARAGRGGSANPIRCQDGLWLRVCWRCPMS